MNAGTESPRATAESAPTQEIEEPTIMLTPAQVRRLLEEIRAVRCLLEAVNVSPPN